MRYMVMVTVFALGLVLVGCQTALIPIKQSVEGAVPVQSDSLTTSTEVIADEQPLTEKVGVSVEQSSVPVASAEPMAMNGGTPSWVYQTPKSDVLHYEAGYAKLSSKANSMKRANVEAKEKLAQWIYTKVEQVSVSFTSDSGEGENRQALEAFETIARQTSEVSLISAAQEEMWEDASGGIWVLCSVMKESTSKAFEDSMREYIASGRADSFSEEEVVEAVGLLKDAMEEE